MNMGLSNKIIVYGHCVSAGSTTKALEMTMYTKPGGFDKLNHRNLYF